MGIMERQMETIIFKWDIGVSREQVDLISI